MKPLLLTFFALLTLSTSAQTPSKKEIRQAVDTIAKLIRNNYVFASVGNNIASHMMSRYERGLYDRLDSWKAFDSAVTHDLKTFSNDGHMYVRYDPKMVKELVDSKPSQDGDSGEDPFFYGAKAAENNYGFSEVKVLEGNVGYIRLSQVNLSEKSLPVLCAAMQFVGNSRALIVDLRDNGGGGSSIGNVIESFFLPKNYPLLQLKTRGSKQQEVQKTVAWLTEKKYTKPCYIIVNKKTHSAAEAIAFSLQKAKRAKVVGQSSGGAAHMNSWYPVNEHIYVSVSTGAPTLPGTDQTWEGTGVQPDYTTQPGKEIEEVLRIVK